MKFQVLSHAGLLVENDGVQLLCDPWLIGSTYWRSWWNYPPVSRELIDSLKPNYIYLTHIHWDHFQGPSLKLFPSSTHIIVPKGHYSRMKRDLEGLGFEKITELRHAQSLQLAPDLKLTSYSFDFHCDSTVVIEDKHTTLLNLNDCKIMGLPLKHLLSRHKRPDFVFCSHSSANSRGCFEIIDDPNAEVDDVTQYIERFYQFVKATNARYAIPFASNQCYLHKETFHFNSRNRTPMMVKEYWINNSIFNPELKVMISGDSWSYENGFTFGKKDWFTNRNKLLREYQEEKEKVFNEYYEQEKHANVSLYHMRKYFSKFIKAIPFFVKFTFKNHPIVYVLYAGGKKFIYQVNLYTGAISELHDVNDKAHPLQIHLSANVMRHALSANLLAHLGIGKRVKYRVTAQEKKYAERLKNLVDLYEYEILPLKNNLRLRSLETWMLRWREIILYLALLKDRLLTGHLNIEKQLAPDPASDR